MTDDRLQELLADARVSLATGGFAMLHDSLRRLVEHLERPDLGVRVVSTLKELTERGDVNLDRLRLNEITELVTERPGFEHDAYVDVAYEVRHAIQEGKI